MPKLLAIIGVVAATLLIAGCTSFGDQTPATTPTAKIAKHALTPTTRHGLVIALL